MTLDTKLRTAADDAQRMVAHLDVPPYEARRYRWTMAVATASVLLLAGLVVFLADQLSNDGTSPVTEPTPTPTSVPRLTQDIPPGVESGTVDTPLGTARWVHLGNDDHMVPSLLGGVAVSWPTGFAIFEPPSPVGSQLWVSADGIEWHVEQLPVPRRAQNVSLSIDEAGVYWLFSSSPPQPDELWRSTDGATWDQYHPSELVPVGPSLSSEETDFLPPVTVGGLTIGYADYGGAFSFNVYGGPNSCERLERELEPRVFAIIGDEGEPGCGERVLRFVETDSGLQVLDDETGEDLGEIREATLADINRFAETGELFEPRILLIGEDTITPVAPPWTLEGCCSPISDIRLFAADDGIYAYTQVDTRFGAGVVTVDIWRTNDGLAWTELGPAPLPFVPAEIGLWEFKTMGDGRLVAWNPKLRNAAYETTDGITWETITWAPLPAVQSPVLGGDDPSGAYPIPLESGWFARDGDAWWIHLGGTWLSLAELGMEGGPVTATAIGDTTFFFTEGWLPGGSNAGDLWILSTDDLATEES